MKSPLHPRLKSARKLLSCLWMLFTMLIAQSPQLFAQQADMFQTYAIVDRGIGNEYYAGGINADAASIFDGLNLGAHYNTGYLRLNGGEVKTFKNNGGDVTGAFLYYRVYKNGTTPPANFTEISLPFTCEGSGCLGASNPGDQKWSLTAHNVSLLDGLSPGDYFVEVFWKITTNLGDRFDSRPGNDYKAFFTVLETPVYNWNIGDWGTCSQECGSGIQTRIVACKDQFGNVVSESNCTDIKPPTAQPCNTQECPVYSWNVSDWGTCSQECGSGIQTRIVVCKDQFGNVVPESNCTDIKPPTAQPCNTQECPVDCVLSEWSAWSDWSTDACGETATRTRTRTVLVEATNGGLACGPLSETETRTNVPCPIDCVLSEWSEWSIWSSDACGETATRTRTRTVLVEPAYGGLSCGPLSETETRTNPPCPIDCVLSEWSEWSTWSSDACGETATRTRTRTVLVEAANGGLTCGPLTETETRTNSPCLVYEWLVGDWSSCSVTCGTGTQTRSVLCKDQFGNVVADGNCTAVRPSSTQSCTIDVVDAIVGLSSPTPVAVGGTSTINLTVSGSIASGQWVYSLPSSATAVETSTQVSITNSEAGVIAVTYVYTDLCGAEKSTLSYAVFYDPNGGFVTGGGWIQSPAGAYKPNPSLVGKASFGFVSKYRKGSDVPTGNTEFEFSAGNFKFRSTAYDALRLVIAGAKANFKGYGTVNDIGNYRFVVSAIDGQVSGGGGVDKFRIKIWDEANGMVIYDNNVVPGNSGEEAEPEEGIKGGSIVIHEVRTTKAAAISADFAVSKLDILSFNNPSLGSTAFRLQVVSNDRDAPIQLRITDIQGRSLEMMSNLRSGATVEVGRSYVQGMYFVEAIQGEQRKVVKLLKQ